MRSLRERIRLLSLEAQRAIVSASLDILPGTKFVDEQTEFERLQICETCEHMNKKTRKCMECKCFIDEKIKVFSLPFVGLENCPKNKW